ncbi:YibE/F family protein [Thaumasiovibrio subtropicus]|uniref:YibE/F family protein n=1 Tax=Thaumasiovibrio subtropicus TaxID=1891207 RepID=UPI000B35BF9C|nr:YibE/F family protein [Thaumasiovibrio subtropicus]
MKKSALFSLFIVIVSTLVLYLSPIISDGFRPTAYANQTFVKAWVDEVLVEQVQPDVMAPNTLTGRQRLLVRYQDEHNAWQQVEVENSLSRLHNVHVAEGDRFIMLIRGESERVVYWPFNHDRANAVYWMVGIVVVLIILLAGIQGLNSVISLYFTSALLVGVLIPAIFAGCHPVWITLLLMALKIIVNFLLIAGWNRKSLVAMLGTLCGVIVAGVMAQLFGEFAQLNGLYLDKGEDLLYLGGQAQIQIRWLLFVAIMISALGAVMDVAISMVSSYHELREANPEQDEKARLIATVRIGRDILGTMTNTLVLAFVGSALTTMMMVWGFQMPVMQFMNIPAIALAMIHALAGSIGLILTVPMTVAISSFVYHRHGDNRNGGGSTATEQP